MSIDRSPEVSNALAQAVLEASRQQGILFGFAFSVGGIYEQLGRNIAGSARSAARSEYQRSLNDGAIDAENTIGEVRP